MKKIDVEFQEFLTACVGNWGELGANQREAMRFAFYGGAIVGAGMQLSDLTELYTSWTAELIARERSIVVQKGAQA